MKTYYVDYYVKLKTPDGRAIERVIENRHLREPMSLKAAKQLLKKWQELNPGTIIAASYREHIELF